MVSRSAEAARRPSTSFAERDRGCYSRQKIHRPHKALVAAEAPGLGANGQTISQTADESSPREAWNNLAADGNSQWAQEATNEQSGVAPHQQKAVNVTCEKQGCECAE